MTIKTSHFAYVFSLIIAGCVISTVGFCAEYDVRRQYVIGNKNGAVDSDWISQRYKIITKKCIKEEDIYDIGHGELNSGTPGQPTIVTAGGIDFIHVEDCWIPMFYVR
jgi:hypothetical protein